MGDFVVGGGGDFALLEEVFDGDFFCVGGGDECEVFLFIVEGLLDLGDEHFV